MIYARDTIDDDAQTTDAIELRLAYTDLCKPQLAKFLTQLKLDYIYHRASANYLFTMKQGREVAILDLVGGYGSTILGHNHDELKMLLKQMLDDDKPIQAQGSIRPGTARLATILNSLIREKFAQFNPPAYILHLMNTGTEATEGAIKHALMEWHRRKDEIIHKARTLRSKYRNRQLTGMETHKDELVIAINAINQTITKVEALQPRLIAINGSFHGKTAGSLAVTNPAYSWMYRSFAVERSFLSPTLDEQEVQCYFASFLVQLMEGSSFSCLIGVIVELVQGEGGVKPLPKPFVKNLESLCRTTNIPLIVDEVQTGMWRTGKFLASEQFDILPDYVTLGKSLGGGMTKIAALLIQKDRYQAEFGMVHTSTFAEDELSARVASKTIAIIKHLEPSPSELAAAFHEQLVKGLRDLSSRHLGVICEVRSSGFLVGIEFASSFPQKSAPLVTVLANTGHYAYMLASYLLHHHNIRVAATLNNTSTLRIEPSLFLSQLDIEHTLNAFEDLVGKIAAGHFLAICAHLWQDADRYHASTVSSFKPRREIVADPLMRKVNFLSHIIDESTLAALDPVFAELSERDINYFLNEIGPDLAPFTYHQQVIHGKNGKNVLLSLQGLMVSSRYFEKAIRTSSKVACDKVRTMALAAYTDGASHVGLGQFTSIVTHNGLHLEDIPLHITTGNSYTVGASYMALLDVINHRGLQAGQFTVGIVGAAGNIGCVMAQMLADLASKLVLVHREPLATCTKLQSAVNQITDNAAINPHNITTTTELSELTVCDVLVLSINQTGKIIEPEHLKQNSIVLDISVPSVISDQVFCSRPDVTCIFGGHIRLPMGQRLQHSCFEHMGGEIYACMAETISTALVDYQGCLSLGPLTKKSVLEAVKLATEVGMELGSTEAELVKKR